MRRNLASLLGLSICGVALLAWLGISIIATSEDTNVLATGRTAILIRELEDKDDNVRLFAAWELAKLGPEAAPAIPALIRALQSRKTLNRPLMSMTFGDQTPTAARETLVSIGPAAVPALTKALRHKDALTRVHAAWALWDLENKAEAVLPVIVQAWQDNELLEIDVCIRGTATGALGSIGKKEPGLVLPLVSPALNDEDEETVYSAMYVLAIMAGAQRRAMETLVHLLGDKREGVANVAGWKLREIPDAVPFLLLALKSGNPRLRWRAAWTLGGMPDARPELQALKELLQDNDMEVRKWAAWAVSQHEKAAAK